MRRSLLLATATTLLLTAPIASSALAVTSVTTSMSATTNANQAATRDAAGWLARELTNGDHITSGDFDDHGLTADTVLALTSAKVAGTAATNATDWLARPENTTAYIGDGVQESYAGAHAKLALVAISQGRDPENFGGRNLLTELTDLQEDSGRFSDKSQYGNYSNAFSQSLAILALHRTPIQAPAKAVDFLVASQCPDGSLPLAFGESTCTGHVDATGLAVQAMLATGHDESANRALTWLASTQKSNGGFAEKLDDVDAGNSNSTGSAMQALNAGKHPAAEKAATKAAAFLRGIQIGCSGAVEQRGAITYDGTFNAAKDKRATAGALLGLSGVSM
ncbi:MAG: peptidase, partial [Longispora sp.]|nr:peptidase [Longispora sp. (in: high G+C Gram-positive bacteria)]